jgi:hypothetical protein
VIKIENEMRGKAVQYPQPFLAADLDGRAQYTDHGMKEGRGRKQISFSALPPFLPSLPANFRRLAPRFQFKHFKGQKRLRQLYICKRSQLHTKHRLENRKEEALGHGNEPSGSTKDLPSPD